MSTGSSSEVVKIGERFPWMSFLGAALFFLLFVIVMSIVYVPQRLDYNVDQIRINERLKILTELQSKSKKEAQSYAWVDSKAGTVSIPIQRAIDLFVKEHAE